jgi:hypothetical protein
MYTDKLLKEFCLLNQIKLQTSPPYHHASNGLAERAVQTIMDKTRTIMLANYAPVKYWEEAISTAVYLLNRIPLKKLNWKTPFQLVYNEIPDISHLVPFYSKGVYHVTKDEVKNVFSSRAIECWMVGYYELGKNQYYVLEKNGKITNRRNCVFDEIQKYQNDEIQRIEKNGSRQFKKSWVKCKNEVCLLKPIKKDMQ